MNQNENIEVGLLAAMASDYINELFHKGLSAYDQLSLKESVHFVTRQIYLSCEITAESTLLLAKYERDWDSEILVRSVSEGCIKGIYILECDEDTQNERAEEYWSILPEISELRQSERAAWLVGNLESDIESMKPIEDIVIPDSEIYRIKEVHGKQKRKMLEQKWSFMELLRYFQTSGNKRLNALAGLAYNYGISSNLVHKDGTGVALMSERITRSDIRRIAISKAHISRCISDVCTFMDVFTGSIFIASKIGKDGLVNLREKYKSLFIGLSKHYDNFYAIEYDDNSA